MCSILNSKFFPPLFFSARVLTTAGVEIPQEAVLREQLLLWMVHNTVSPSPTHLCDMLYDIAIT